MKRHASMNRIYRLVWNQVLNAWVAVAETSRGRGKSSSRNLIAAVLSLTAAVAQAAPVGGQVVAGAGSISQSTTAASSTTTIQQSSQNLSLNWQSFNIAPQETVNFVQPSATAIAVNRIFDTNGTQILGHLNANGQVYLINPNGILFGQGAQVNVGGLVASTLDLNDASLNGNVRSFSGNGTGSVINQGTINSATGGYVALLGNTVSNQGTISAQLGTVALGAGSAATLTFNGNSLVQMQVDQSTLNNLSDNGGLIRADGGVVLMSAGAKNELLASVVNNTGVIEARTVENHEGIITLLGGMTAGTVNVGGTLDASSATSQGGKVVVTGEHVLLDNGARIVATGATGGGEVYVGGGWQGKDASIDNASAVVMQPTAIIDVSATASGNGGTAVLWSQDYTNFAGNIAAKGGKDSGNGGNVETSSHNILQAFGQVDASAANGRAGSWLLDPWNVTITGFGISGTPYAASFTPTADSSITATSISNSLTAGTNVTITTGTDGGSFGDITVNGAMAPIPQSSYPSLTLSAARNININTAISASGPNGMNVTLTADADHNGSGNVNFGASGQISTNGNVWYGGNFNATGQNLTMADGSFIDTGGNSLAINMTGDVTLAANSLRAQHQYYTNITVAGASIATSNAVATTPDIVTTASVTLNAGTIGSVGAPIKISAGASASPYADSLSITNTSGSSYVNEIGKQAFGSINMTVGSQASRTQNVQIMGDAGGDGTTGTGHVLLQTDDAGLLNIATNNIKTAGGSGVSATHVSVTAPNMTFANGSVNTGTANFTASVSDTMTSIQVDGTGDISAPTVSLNGPNLGTSTNPLELGVGTNLYVNNTGGSTFIKSVSNNYTNIFLTNVKTTGAHHILFNDSASATSSDGDHIDYTTNDTDVFLPTISGGASDGVTFGSTTGIDVTRLNRNVTLTANSGNIIFDNTSVNTGSGKFTAQIYYNNNGVIAALNAYDAGATAAQITAGDVEFDVYNYWGEPHASTIGSGGKDIQIAQGAGASDNTLTVYTQQGDIKIHELTANHFKTLNVTLDGASPVLSATQLSATQNVAIDLKGPEDDVNFSDDGSQVLIDATKVNLSANNRNWYLYTPSRSIQIDGVSLGTGSYSVSAGGRLTLNSDVVTNGGPINLYGGGGIDLLKNVDIHSNSDGLGNGGTIILSGGTISSGGGSEHSLTVDSSSTDSNGGQIQIQNNMGHAAGDYLSGLTVTAAGGNPDGSQDGTIYFQGTSYLLNGNFTSTGYSYLYTGAPFTIDTEQGNHASAGNIIFNGLALGSYPYATINLDTSTTASGANGGNVDLYSNIDNHFTLSSFGLAINTTGGGSGGTDGYINLPAVSTTYSGQPNAQSYTGGIITLHGDLLTDKGAITLTGDTRLASSVTLRTWVNDTNVQNGTAGAVTIDGTGISATSTGKNLTIDTSTNTGTPYFNPPTNTLDFTQSGGNVIINASNVGGAYVNNLSVITTTAGTNNVGATTGTIALNTVGTEGSQTYTGGATTVSGSLTTNGGNIDLSGVASLALSGPDVTFATDRTGGTGNAGSLLGANTLNGAVAVTIDTTADGGGAGTDLTLTSVGAGTPLSSLNARAANLTVSDSGVTSSGNITLSAMSALNVNAAVTNAAGTGDIVLNAGTTIGLGASVSSLGAITLNHGGALTQTAGTVDAPTLNLNGIGAVGTDVAPLATSAATIILNKAPGAGATFVHDTSAVAVSGTTGGSLTLASDSDISVDQYLNLATTGASDGNITLQADNNITIAGRITTSGYAVTLNSDHDASGAGAITLTNSSIVVTNGGNITLRGGSAALDALPDPTVLVTQNDFISGLQATGARGEGLNLPGVTLGGGLLDARGASSGGNIEVRGVGAAGMPGIASNSTVMTNGSGTVALYGAGGGTDNGNDGVFIGGSVTTESGAITIYGLGRGVDFGRGVVLQGGEGQASVRSASGPIVISGASQGLGGSNQGVMISYGIVQTTDGGNITITGQGSTNGTGTNNEGVNIAGYSTVEIQNGADRTLTITGTGGTGTDNNIGVSLLNGSVVSMGDTVTGNSNINITGTGGDGEYGNYGIYLSGTGTSITSKTGAISIIGQGAGIYDYNYGIFMDGGAAVTSTDTATITLNGTGGAGEYDNYGVYLSGAGTNITSSSGAISITGQSEGTGQGNYGIVMDDGAAVTSTDIATITLNGTGGAGTDYNYGVYLSGTDTNITSSNGAISITGQGTGTDTSNHGIVMDGGAAVASTDTAAITLNGTGGAGTDDNYGVYLSGAGTNITSSNGAISIAGQGAGSGQGNYGIFMDGGAAVTSTDTATITLDGRGAGDAEGIYTSTFDANNTIGGAASNGNITLIADTATGADSLFLSGLEISGTGNLVLQPLNATTTIGLAGGAGTFNLDATELSTILSGFASITIGHENGTGLISFGDGSGTGFTFNANTTLRNPGVSSGGMTIIDSLSVGVNNLTLNSAGTVDATFGAISAAGLELLGTGGTHTLTNTGNAITTLAGNTGAVNYQQAASLVIGSVGATTGLTAANGLLVRTTGDTADLTLTNGVTVDSAGDALVLAAGRNFINNFGPSALAAPNGRWLVYSISPADSYENGLTAVAGSSLPRLYNKTYVANSPATIAAGNHLLYSTQPTLTVTADNQTHAYGDANAPFAATITGFVSDDGVTDTTITAGLAGAPAFTSLATATSAVSGSPFAITATAGTLASSAGYNFGFADGVLTVTARPVTVMADPGQTKVYGNADPGAFTFTTTSLGGGIALSGSLTRVAGETVLGGPYAITQGTLSNANNSNYSLTYTGNALTINPATLTVTADPTSRLYGAANPALSGSVTGFVNGELLANVTTGTESFSSSATNSSNVGSYGITGAGLTANNGNYVFSQAAGNATALTINKAHLTVTADDKSRLYGAANPILTTTVSGFVNGETAGTAAGFGGSGSATTLADASTAVGSAAITANASTLEATNYDFTHLVDGTLTINPATLTVKPVTPPEPVQNAIAQLESNILAPRASTKPEELSLSPTITVTQSSSPDTDAGGDASSSGSGNSSPDGPRWRVAIDGGDASSSGSDNGTVVNTTMNIGGGTGPSLQVVNGGIKLPDNIVDMN